MKFVTKKETTKKVIMLILLILTLNFITPNISIAKGAYGGELFTPIFQMLAGIGDLVIKGLQYIFLGDGDVLSVETGTQSFIIEYSPAAIFANEVPALDINFFKPHVDKKVTIEQSTNTAEERLENGGAKKLREHNYTGTGSGIKFRRS